MKKVMIRFAVILILIGTSIWLGNSLIVTSEAEIAFSPGSIEDPVVTKSYLDEQLAKLGVGGNPGGTTEDAALEVVTVPAGQTLMAGQGTEVIVRVGKAIAYSSESSGIADLTGGSDLTNGTAVPTNHLLLFPRDGRGILPDPAQKNGLTVLVRGGYTLQ